MHLRAIHIHTYNVLFSQQFSQTGFKIIIGKKIFSKISSWNYFIRKFSRFTPVPLVHLWIIPH